MQHSKTTTHSGMTLFVVVALSFLATIDSSIVNIALPVMANDLHVTTSAIAWVVASYVMIICAALLFFGRLGDIRGKVSVFRAGTIVFLIGTLLCGLCRSFVPLIICRFLQGLGAGAFMANNQGIITQLYPKEGRGKALGVLAAAVALGTMSGAPIGGLIVSRLSWNYIFFVNIPVGTIVFLFGLVYLPVEQKNATEHKQRIDMPGFLLQFLGTILLFGALIESQQIGFMHPAILGALASSILFIILFIKRESCCQEPLLDLSLFSNKLFSVSLLSAFISFICIAAYTILLPFYFEDTLKLGPSLSGVLMMTAPLIIAALSPVCGTLSDKIGSEMLSAAGLLVMSAAFFFMTLLSASSRPTTCILILACMAVGQALFQPANNSLIMSACPRTKLGIGGSVNSLVRNLGQYSGIVLSTTFLYFFMSTAVGYRVTDYIKGRDDIFVFGMKRVFFILMGFCIVGAALTIYRAVVRSRYREAS